MDEGGGAIGPGPEIPGRAMKCPDDDTDTSESEEDQGPRGRGMSGVLGGDKGIR